MPDIGGDEGGDLGNLSPAAGSRDRAPVGDLGAKSSRSCSFSVYSGPKILCFATQSV